MPEIPVAAPDFDARLQADVRPARRRLSDQHDAHRDVHDDGRGQQHAVPAHRRAGRVPSAVAPRGEQDRRWRSSSLVQSYHSEVFAGFLEKLAKMPDGDAGSMLDNSIFLYGSNMSNSNKHDSFPLPTLVFGHGGGIKGHQHLRYPDHTPIANLLLHADAARRRAGRVKSATARARSRRFDHANAARTLRAARWQASRSRRGAPPPAPTSSTAARSERSRRGARRARARRGREKRARRTARRRCIGPCTTTTSSS